MAAAALPVASESDKAIVIAGLSIAEKFLIDGANTKITNEKMLIARHAGLSELKGALTIISDNVTNFDPRSLTERDKFIQFIKNIKNIKNNITHVVDLFSTAGQLKNEVEDLVKTGVFAAIKKGLELPGTNDADYQQINKILISSNLAMANNKDLTSTVNNNITDATRQQRFSDNLKLLKTLDGVNLNDEQEKRTLSQAKNQLLSSLVEIACANTKFDRSQDDRINLINMHLKEIGLPSITSMRDTNSHQQLNYDQNAISATVSILEKSNNNTLQPIINAPKGLSGADVKAVHDQIKIKQESLAAQEAAKNTEKTAKNAASVAEFHANLKIKQQLLAAEKALKQGTMSGAAQTPNINTGAGSAKPMTAQFQQQQQQQLPNANTANPDPTPPAVPSSTTKPSNP